MGKIYNRAIGAGRGCLGGSSESKIPEVTPEKRIFYRKLFSGQIPNLETKVGFGEMGCRFCQVHTLLLIHKINENLSLLKVGGFSDKNIQKLERRLFPGTELFYLRKITLSDQLQDSWTKPEFCWHERTSFFFVTF